MQKNGQKVIVDGPKTLQFIYNAYYWYSSSLPTLVHPQWNVDFLARFTNIASLSSIPVTFLEKEYDFWVAYLLTTTAICLSIALFLVWGPKLGERFPGSPVTHGI